MQLSNSTFICTLFNFDYVFRGTDIKRFNEIMVKLVLQSFCLIADLSVAVLVCKSTSCQTSSPDLPNTGSFFPIRINYFLFLFG